MRPTSSEYTATRTADLALDAVRAAAAMGPAPVGLDPGAYARDHAEFEARSDQRALITAYLCDRLLARGPAPVSVLSVGCGDGSVDAAVARALVDAEPGRAVRYVGVEPFAGSAAAFTRRMQDVASPVLDAEVQVTTFDAATFTEQYDVVVFVHSMYYVPDVARAVLAAHALLRPGGELVVLSAPRAELNALGGVLAPPVQGHRQWFSDDVADGFAASGLSPVSTGVLHARVDLDGASDDVLDFTVQARLTSAVRPLVRDYLAAVSLDGNVTVSHPVDVYRVSRD
ncbi:class I SAM-dependent methyltransferase [Solicola sp. PLA-1-18]|uniref:class I SAM-dependent methyltransferase n=1 Tax=Solicola sp. PLA-1-18 TaxID=3380532 RepID=UPI003B81A96B